MRPARHVRCAASRKPRAMWSHRIIVSNGSRTLVTSTQVPSGIKVKFGNSATTIISKLKGANLWTSGKEWAYHFISELIRSDCITAYQA